MGFSRYHYHKAQGRFEYDLDLEKRKSLYNSIAHYIFYKGLNDTLVEKLSNDLGWGGKNLYSRDGDDCQRLAKSLPDFFYNCHFNWCLDTLDVAYVVLSERGDGDRVGFEETVNNKLWEGRIPWMLSRGKWYKLDQDFVTGLVKIK